MSEHINEYVGLQCEKTKALFSRPKLPPQPNILIRAALFTPDNRIGTPEIFEQRDVTTELKQTGCFSLGWYDMATISGPKLNVQVDFKIWRGIILTFSKYGLNDKKITLKFTEFAKYCGYKPQRFTKKLRLRVEKSLDKIQSQAIEFKTKDAKKPVATELLLKCDYDVEKDVIVLLADESLWEIFTLNHQVLNSLDVLAKLHHKEVAQCLYLYFASFPQNPYPITYESMQNRLKLSMVKKEVNRSIRVAIKNLEELGFLKGEWVVFQNEKAYKIM
jgi:hypothetical protein